MNLKDGGVVLPYLWTIFKFKLNEDGLFLLDWNMKQICALIVDTITISTCLHMILIWSYVNFFLN